MKKQVTYDLTQGGITGKLLLVALPIVGTQLMQMTYNLTDMFWLGRVSRDAVAASGTAGMYTWMSMALLLIGRMGAEIGVAQSKGQQDETAAKEYSRTSFWIAAVLGVLYGAAMILFRDPLIGFFNIREAHVAKDAADYLAVVSAATPMTYIAAALTGTFNGSGNSRVPFYINAVGLVVNMILDPLFILNFGMGIVGAAIATAIGQTVVCVLFIIAICKHKDRPFARHTFRGRLQSPIAAQIFRWSIPIGVESMFFTFLSMIISRFVADFGASAIAVQRVGSQIESLTWLVGGGFASAITAFVGQNYGGGKWGRIHRGCRISLLAISGWGVFVTALLLLGGRVLFSLFLPDPFIVGMGVSYLNILAGSQLFSCLEYGAAGVFRGIGRTLPPTVVSVTGNVLRVPVAWYLSTTSLGLDGIWWGVTLGAILRGIWGFLWYLRLSRSLPREDQNLPGGDSPEPQA